jgi:glyoxylase-like metal-dependent hydrolase (beta-lactamase superfamily II)
MQLLDFLILSAGEKSHAGRALVEDRRFFYCECKDFFMYFAGRKVYVYAIPAMLTIHPFTFNPFSENTYVLYDETKECIILDPGCYSSAEKRELERFIAAEKLKPMMILLTHTHIDHILGNNFLTGRYRIPITMSFLEKNLLQAAPEYGRMWGIEMEPSPEPSRDVTEGKEISFGTSTLLPLFTPGHSPGSFSYFHKESGSLLSGDVLFMQGIGRTDLPGGDYDTLLDSIRRKILPLGDNIVVYPGHGPVTTVGNERTGNPFLTN